MQVTQTITLNPPVQTLPLEEVAGLPQPLYTAAQLIQIKAAHLLQKLAASGLFNTAELQAQQEWGPEFFGNVLPQIASDEGKEEVALALCYLVEDIIFAPFERLMHDPASQNQLVEYENTVKEMIALALPEGQDPDNFLSAYQEYNGKVKTLEMLSAEINTFYQEELAKLYASAREADAELTRHHEVASGRLLTILESKKNAKNQAVTELETVSAKINAVHANVLQQQKSAEALFDRMEKHEVDFQGTLNRADTLINKGKIE